MHLFSRLSLITTVVSAAVLLPATVQAASVAVSHERFHECGLGHVLCDGHHAYSLTEFLNGTVQLPVDGRFGEREFVLVNDTGHAVRLLQFSYFGELTWFTDVDCHIEGDAWWFLHSCTVSGQGANGDGTWWLHARITPPVEFTYTAGSWQPGIPDGAYFDLRAVGFGHDDRGNCDKGYLSGSGGEGSGGNSSGGNGSGGNGSGGNGSGGNGNSGGGQGFK
jgi:hypothetical protein